MFFCKSTASMMDYARGSECNRRIREKGVNVFKLSDGRNEPRSLACQYSILRDINSYGGKFYVYPC
jgi:hypothetical protein